MKIRNWLIGFLGGYTRDQIEDMRLKHEQWALEYLKGKGEEVVLDCSIYKPFGDENLLILRSDVRVLSGFIQSVKVAPWCRRVVLSEIMTR